MGGMGPIELWAYGANGANEATSMGQWAYGAGAQRLSAFRA